ncbi:tyrosine-type recombinase/integrase [Halalkalibacter kiskunsagensis]|uniref:Tyrosine-type recombinase/integrase n=1 Tax=Halalkalibacter kiskunsagensis TaxID=1548599 RepID=A0ABV6K8D0_9BACI
MSLGYFDEKEKVKKRQPHKRKSEKTIQKDSLKIIFERFLEFKQKQNLRPSTLNQHIDLYNSIENFHFSRTDKPFYLSDLTTEFISDYVYWMKNEAVRFEGHKYKPNSAKTVGFADASIEGRLKYLKTFVNWCVKQDKLKKNPFDKFEGFKKDAHTIDILSREEINSLVKVAKTHSKKSYKHYRDFVLLHLLIDGMVRISEALLIAPNDIDHVNRTVIIQSTNAKSRKSRIIPLSNKTYRLITQLIEENELFESEVDDLLFLSLSGRMLDKNNVLRDLRKYAVEAGIKKRFYIHLLRHSCATHYLSSSGDVESLRKILGHADLRTVLNYAHMADTTIVEKHASHGFFSADNTTDRKRSNKRI